MRRLDRFLCQSEWVANFLNITLDGIDYKISNHTPLKIEVGTTREQ